VSLRLTSARLIHCVPEMTLIYCCHNFVFWHTLCTFLGGRKREICSEMIISPPNTACETAVPDKNLITCSCLHCYVVSVKNFFTFESIYASKVKRHTTARLWQTFYKRSSTIFDRSSCIRMYVYRCCSAEILLNADNIACYTLS